MATKPTGTVSSAFGCALCDQVGYRVAIGRELAAGAYEAMHTFSAIRNRTNLVLARDRLPIQHPARVDSRFPSTEVGIVTILFWATVVIMDL